MKSKKLKTFYGNYDGVRMGLIITDTKKKAAQLARCPPHHFNNYWVEQEDKSEMFEPDTLYTKSYRDLNNEEWTKGICEN